MAPRRQYYDNNDEDPRDDRDDRSFHIRAGHGRDNFEVDYNRDHDRQRYPSRDQEPRYETSRSIVARSEAPTVHTVPFSEMNRIRRSALADMIGEEDVLGLENERPSGALVRRATDGYGRYGDNRPVYRDDRSVVSRAYSYRDDRREDSAQLAHFEADGLAGGSRRRYEDDYYDERDQDRYEDDRYDDRRRYDDRSQVTRSSRRERRDSKGAGEGDEVDELKADIRQEENKAIRTIKNNTDRDGTGLGFAAAGALLGALIAGKAGGEENKRAKQVGAGLVGGAFANVAAHHYRKKFNTKKEEIEDKVDDVRKDVAGVIDPQRERDRDSRSQARSRRSRARN